MRTATLRLKDLSCPSCIKKIEGALLKQNGVEDARVLFSASKGIVVFDEEVISVDQLINIVQKLGYPVLTSKVKS
jgi:copper chaperone